MQKKKKYVFRQKMQKYSTETAAATVELFIKNCNKNFTLKNKQQQQQQTQLNQK